MRDIVASFGAEWLKLSRRPATWVLAILLPALLVALGYGLILVEVVALRNTHTTAANHATIQHAIDSLQLSLYPERVARRVLNAFTGLAYGNAIAVIVGVLCYGSEYGWATMKTIFTTRPGRLATFLGKMGATAVQLAIFTVLMFAAAAVAATILGGVYGHLTPWPDALTFVKAFLAAWLLMGLWCALGVLLSVLFRQAALAIGLGIVYAVVVEGVVVNVLSAVSSLRDVQRVFPGANGTALVDSFLNGSSLAGPTQAALVVAAYTAVFLLVSAVLLRHRDVT
jgi:ABC-type transport system involved in multi-copper enzyme maturation permease subunit